MQSMTNTLKTAALIAVCAVSGAVKAATGTWTGGPEAVWDTSANNWSGVSGTPWDSANGGTNDAQFSSVDATPVVSGNVYANKITFTAPAEVSGGTINLAGTTAPTFTVNGNSVTAKVASALSGTNFIKRGDGTLRLTGNSGVGLFLYVSPANVAALEDGGTLLLAGGGVLKNTSAYTMRIGKATANNKMVVTQPDSFWDLSGGSVYFGEGETRSNNVLTVSDHAVVTNGSFYLGGWGAVGNQLLVQEGAKVYGNTLQTGPHNSGTGNSNNTIVVTGTSSLLAVNNLTVGAGVSSRGDWLTIADSAVVNVGTLTVGASSGGNYCSLVVTNQGRLYSTNGLNLNASFNSVLISGAGVLWDGNGKRCDVGNGGSNNVLTVSDGAVASNAYFYIGQTANGFENSVIITNGGKLYASALSYVGYAAGSPNAGNKALVAGSGSLWNNGGQSFTVGQNSFSNTLMVCSNGVIGNVTTLTIGPTAAAHSNSVLVTGGGLLEITSGITLGHASSTANTVKVSGGVLQFKTGTPTITVNGAANGNAIMITNSTVAFAAIDNADVRCNQNGYRLEQSKVSWAGTNTFRLNSATNAASGQAYTFTDTLGATNFAHLSLINGSLWRGGTATIGNGGSLICGTGTNYLDSATFSSGGRLAVTLNGADAISHLVVSGTLNLGGVATIDLALGTAPEFDVDYPVASVTGGGTISGTFASQTVNVNYDGVEYAMKVKCSSTSVSLICQKRGTMISIR